MTPTTEHLMQFATRIADAYTADPLAIAAMVTGSVAENETDRFSDIDMTVYYDSELPTEEALNAARRRLEGAGDVIWSIGSREQGAMAVAFVWQGIECQVGLATVAAWERDMDTVLVQHQADTPLQKALDGTLICKPLYGESYIGRWKARAADYPEELRVAMAERYLRFFPLWGMAGRFRSRDATLWETQALVEGAQNLLGVLSGINRLYYTTFQFKRMRRFIGKMSICPQNLAGRIESLFRTDAETAALEMERLVEEVVVLVETHLPAVDTVSVRKRLGWRQTPW